MNAVEFQATVHNGVITLPGNQQAWNAKKIKVILLDEASSDVTERAAKESTSEADFFQLCWHLGKPRRHQPGVHTR
jgi:hypothetical protein